MLEALVETTGVKIAFLTRGCMKFIVRVLSPNILEQRYSRKVDGVVEEGRRVVQKFTALRNPLFLRTMQNRYS